MVMSRSLDVALVPLAAFGAPTNRSVADATFNIHQPKTQLSRILQRVVDGDEIVIAKAGKPIARLVPFNATLALDPRLGALENARRADIRRGCNREADLYATRSAGGVSEATQDWADSLESSECVDGD
jgi:prevent-host-death family protein